MKTKLFNLRYKLSLICLFAFSLPLITWAQPGNDLCTNPTILAGNLTACPATPTAGTLVLATNSVGVSTTCGTTNADVWYQFTATTAYPSIILSSIGNSLQSRLRVGIYSGACGGFTLVTCIGAPSASTQTLTTTSVAGGAGLTVGQTYFIRVGTSDNPVSGTYTFRICIDNPAPGNITYSKTYINVSKTNTGGTIFPGDTLEMRTTFVVSTAGNAADSLAFIDTIYNGGGLEYIPGSLMLRTNEGKDYKGFTDSEADNDAGFIRTVGSNTRLQMNFGRVASKFARGKLNHFSRPSVFNGTCIIMATYRVRVTAPFNTNVNFRTGLMQFRDSATGVHNTTPFTPSYFRVYSSPGLCPDAISTNAIGAEFNGTFGADSTLPLARNRSASPYTNYTYTLFGLNAAGTAAVGPNDYRYGITSNTSGRFTVLNNFPKPATNDERIFDVWDISGDHTGAANPLIGNPPCDTTQPISAANPCGYMLVVNSAYKGDTAFNYTVSNLCPNTYYEISAWFKNMCYRCGCDSLGRGTTNVGYMPTGVGDSTGVRPNIAFDVNGIDYYTTGDIGYAGIGNTTSDASNRWVKRGFVYLTGPAETSFNLTLRNNAPGGGGNDWALDDIGIATCLPTMSYSPSSETTSCQTNAVIIGDTVRSFFPNYISYQWQKSTDNGVTFTNIPGESGVITPTNMGGYYQYITTYTVPPAQTQSTNDGDIYRVITATSTANLTNADCQATDGTSVTMNILDCGWPLKTTLLSFNANLVNGSGNLRWTTNREDEALTFEVERSSDGATFKTIATIKSHENYTAESNSYNFNDTLQIHGKMNYRIAMRNAGGRTVYSRIIQLSQDGETMLVSKLVNPFRNEIQFNLSTSKDKRIEVTLLNGSGAIVRRQNYMAYTGISNLVLPGLESLNSGLYILQIRDGDKTISHKVVKN